MKPWWQSKTVLINGAVLLATFLIDAHGDLAKLGIPPVWVERIVVGGNLILRLVTSGKLLLTAKGEPQ